MSQQHNIVIEYLSQWGPRSVLNIGLRPSSNLDVYHWCETNRVLHCTVEIHKPNQQFILDERLGFLIAGDIVEIAKKLPRFDAVVWLHGPEHLTLDHLSNTLAYLEASAIKGLLFQMPEQPEYTPFLHGNPWERHLSNPDRAFWSHGGYTYDASAAGVENTATYWKCK